MKMLTSVGSSGGSTRTTVQVVVVTVNGVALYKRKVVETAGEIIPPITKNPAQVVGVHHHQKKVTVVAGVCHQPEKKNSGWGSGSPDEKPSSS